MGLWYVVPAIFVIALLYSSVGHGGASGYLALMGLIGIEPSLMKSSALILNIFVAGIAFTQYYLSGHFKFRLFWPFALGSIPMAFIGATIHINPQLYKQILGVCLVIAALRIFGIFRRPAEDKIKNPAIWIAILVGAALGFISGMIGIGGGILLSPIMLLCGWGRIKEISAVSALFILVNSVSGLSALVKAGQNINPQLFLWVGVAIIGALAGSWWGSRKATNVNLSRTLAVVLIIAAIKLVLV
jgi:uncharacterized membrane protein YfcA